MPPPKLSRVLVWWKFVVWKYVLEGRLGHRVGAEGIDRHAVGIAGRRRRLGGGIAGHGAAGRQHRVLRRIHVLQVLVVDQVDRQAVLAMGVEQVPVEAAIHEGAVKAGLHAEHAVDAAGGVGLGLAIADQELAQLEGVAGLHRRAELRRIGAVVAQLRSAPPPAGRGCSCRKWPPG